MGTSVAGVIDVAVSATSDHNRIIENHFYDNAAAAIFSNATSDLSILGNVIERSTGTQVSAFYLQGASSSIISDNLIDTMAYAGMILDPITSSTVQRNRIQNTVSHGINVANASGPATIQNNFINNANTGHSADSGAIRFYGSALIGALTIQDNMVRSSYNGISVRDANSDLTGKTVTVTGNVISRNSNSGIHHTGLGSIDAINNYWGDPTGPYEATGNAGGLGNSVPASCTYSPFLTATPF